MKEHRAKVSLTPTAQNELAIAAMAIMDRMCISCYRKSIRTASHLFAFPVEGRVSPYSRFWYRHFLDLFNLLNLTVYVKCSDMAYKAFCTEVICGVSLDYASCMWWTCLTMSKSMQPKQSISETHRSSPTGAGKKTSKNRVTDGFMSSPYTTVLSSSHILLM